MITHEDHTCAFVATVFYCSGDCVYARETFELEAFDAFDAERLARERANASSFHNLRVPDLDIAVLVEDRPVPGDDPPPATPGAVRPVCPRCASADIVREACAHWDPALQRWVLASTYDSETCLACDAEGDLIARWEAVELDGSAAAEIP